MRRMVAIGIGLAVVLPALAVVVMVDAIASLAQCGNGTPTANVTAPAQAVQTMGQDAKYLESEGLSAYAAAGIVGNLMQESTLNPTEPGYGLAQWNPGWWTLASAWISAYGQNPETAGGQLMYIAANVQDDIDGEMFYQGLTSDLAHTTSAQQAAIVWMNDYEQCSGAGPAGSLTFTPGSLCEAEQRQSYAAQALQAAGNAHGAGGVLLTSATAGGSCNASFPLTGNINGYTNPFEKATGIVWERTDQGVDATMTAGSPLLAFAPSKVQLIVGDFYAGEPAIVFQITAGPLAGKWWYWSEQIQPTVSPRADRQRRPGRSHVCALRNRHRDRLVGAQRRLSTRARLRRQRLHRGKRDDPRRRLPLPAASARRKPRHRRRPVHRHHDRHQLLPRP